MRVTLAYAWEGPDGVKHRPDTTVTVPDDVGRDLILIGRAREPGHDDSTTED